MTEPVLHSRDFAKGTLSTVGSGWNSSSLGADGRLVLGSVAPSLSRLEGRRRVGPSAPEMSFTLTACHGRELGSRTW